jgi:hypothetical protein
MKRNVAAPVCISLCLILSLPGAAGADDILTWNANAGRAAIAACLSPGGNALAEARMYAMVHAAMHDALNAVDRQSRPYVFDAAVTAPTSASAAIAAAARDVLVSVIMQLQESPACIQSGVASVDADYALALGAIPNGVEKTRGIALGQAAGAAVIALRAVDGSDTPVIDPAYPQGTQPGEYQFTPGTPFAFAPGWGNVTPFVLERSSQFRSGPPYRVDSKNYADDFNEVKSLGGDGLVMNSRTPEETEIAFFWVESAPLAWNRLARDVSIQRQLTLHENARLFGLLNLAMADGYIGSFEGKYHYNFWRPVTAIHLADTDGNPDTAGDPTWIPALGFTYPMPDHDSAHAVEGGAAAEVLKQFFGTDDIVFSACSLTLPAGSTCTDATPKLRFFSSFSAAAEENGRSRILVGIHFRRAVTEGIEHGRKIGRRAASLYLKPVRN